MLFLVLAQNYSPPRNNDKASDGNILRSFILFWSVQTIFFLVFLVFVLYFVRYFWLVCKHFVGLVVFNVEIRISEGRNFIPISSSPFIFQLSDKLLYLARGFESHAKRKQSVWTVISMR